MLQVYLGITALYVQYKKMDIHFQCFQTVSETNNTDYTDKYYIYK